MPKALAPEKREAIAADLRAGKSARQTARDHGVSQSTVSRIAADEHIALDRSLTKSATAAAVADAAKLRAVTSRRFLDECNKLLDELHQPHIAFNFGGKDNTYEEHAFNEPPADTKRTLLTAAAIAFDKHIAQDKHDSDDDVQMDAAKSLLGAVMEGVTARHGSGDDS